MPFLTHNSLIATAPAQISYHEQVSESTSSRSMVAVHVDWGPVKINHFYVGKIEVKKDVDIGMSIGSNLTTHHSLSFSRLAEWSLFVKQTSFHE